MNNIEIEILRSSYGGDGIGYIDGVVCFVSKALPGEKVTVKNLRKSKNFIRAEIDEILLKSEHRLKPLCQYCDNYRINAGVYNCAGCTYQHVDYIEEVRLKCGQFIDLLKRIGGINEPNLVNKIFADNPYFYRNKITLHKGTINSVVGFYTEDNTSVINIDNCFLAMHPINNSFNEVKKIAFDNLEADSVTVRYTECDGIYFFTPSKKNKIKVLTEKNDYGTFLVPAESFYQVNHYMHNKMLDMFFNILKSLNVKHAIDLYCGIGIFGIIAASSGIEKVIAVDKDESAIKLAQTNADIANVTNIDFYASSSEDVAGKCFDLVSPEKTVLIIDPPRTGMNSKLIERILKNKLKHLIYISCAPDTLSRDLKLLTKEFYCLEQTNFIDMFPRTKHFESISLLTLKKG